MISHKKSTCLLFIWYLICHEMFCKKIKTEAYLSITGYFVHAIFKSLEMPLIEWLKFTIYLHFYGCLEIKLMKNAEKKIFAIIQIKILCKMYVSFFVTMIYDKIDGWMKG